MGKPLETVVDERGRVLIPQELREEVGLDEGTVVNLQKGKGRIYHHRSRQEEEPDFLEGPEGHQAP
jgi:AbrB family looped-hinge helix DNA binding protein